MPRPSRTMLSSGDAPPGRSAGSENGVSSVEQPVVRAAARLRCKVLGDHSLVVDGFAALDQVL